MKSTGSFTQSFNNLIYNKFNKLINHELFVKHMLYDRYCWVVLGNNGELQRTSLHHQGAYSLVGEVDADHENHTGSSLVV